MNINRSEEWQLRVLRAVLVGIASYMILSFFIGLPNEILAQAGSANASPVPYLFVLSLFLAILFAVSSIFCKVPALRSGQSAGEGKKKMSIEWKIRAARAVLITSAVFISCLVIANALANVLTITSGYSQSISGYEGGLFIWSMFLGLASILFEAPSELPSLSLKRLSPGEKAKVKKIAIFFLTVFAILIFIIVVLPSLISGYFPALTVETLIGMVASTSLLALIVTMGFVLLLTSKSTN